LFFFLTILKQERALALWSIEACDVKLQFHLIVSCATHKKLRNAQKRDRNAFFAYILLCLCVPTYVNEKGLNFVFAFGGEVVLQSRY
jgi:hypothetical protein